MTKSNCVQDPGTPGKTCSDQYLGRGIIHQYRPTLVPDEMVDRENLQAECGGAGRTSCYGKEEPVPEVSRIPLRESNQQKYRAISPDTRLPGFSQAVPAIPVSVFLFSIHRTGTRARNTYSHGTIFTFLPARMSPIGWWLRLRCSNEALLLHGYYECRKHGPARMRGPSPVRKTPYPGGTGEQGSGKIPEVWYNDGV